MNRAITLACFALAACAPTYSRPATTQQDFDRDKRECTEEVAQRERDRIAMSGGIYAVFSLSPFKSCMIGRGYTIGSGL